MPPADSSPRASGHEAHEDAAKNSSCPKGSWGIMFAMLRPETDNDRLSCVRQVR